MNPDRTSIKNLSESVARHLKSEAITPSGNKPTGNRPPKPAFFAMCCGEPFRIFFPLGLFVGIVGLSLWPLYFWKILPIYPAFIHSRFMVEGFMAAFIFGFLGTAGPRLLNAPHFSKTELSSMLALYFATLGGHLMGSRWLGDAFFLALLLFFSMSLAKRFFAREELPPPNFVLVGCGILSGIIGSTLVLIGVALGNTPQLSLLGTLLLEQNFVLLPLLGVGVFLFPRFLGVPFGDGMQDLRKLTPIWKRKALFAAGAAAAVSVSFVIESAGYLGNAGYLRSAGAVRFLAVTLYIVTQMPAVLAFRRAPFAGQCIRVAIWVMLFGLLWPVFLPEKRIAGFHMIFIGGFMLTVFTVGTRVILGHSGQPHLFSRRLPFLLTTAILLILSMVARVGADFMPGIARNVHLIYAALICITGALVWGIRLVPRVFIPDTDDE